MGLYREHLLPRLVDWTCGSADLRGWRERTATGLSGTVVEIGFGSGLNLPHYPPSVDLVYAVEPAFLARQIAEPRIQQARQDAHLRVEHVGTDGAEIDLPEDSCDGALSTFTLCTIPRVEETLAEILRVLRPGAALHVLEHGLSPERAVARVQRLVEPVQKVVADGCHLTRDPLALLSDAGFEVINVHQAYGSGPQPWTWLTSAVGLSPG